MKDLFKKYWWILVIVLVVILLIVGLVIGIGIKKDKDYEKDVFKACNYIQNREEVVGRNICESIRKANILYINFTLSGVREDEIKEYLEREFENAVNEVSVENREELKIDFTVNTTIYNREKSCHYIGIVSHGEVKEFNEVCHKR